jgi:hypothetical protein
VLNLSNIRARRLNPGLTCLYKGERDTWVGSLMFYASVRLIKKVVTLQKFTPKLGALLTSRLYHIRLAQSKTGWLCNTYKDLKGPLSCFV